MEMIVSSLVRPARAGLLALLAAGIACGAAAPALARGGVSFSLGVPLGAPYYYPPPVYYPPPPVYYAPPPPVVYSPPPPVTYAPAPVAAPVRTGTCREYQATTTIDGRPQPTYGTACLQADGSWRIVE